MDASPVESVTFHFGTLLVPIAANPFVYDCHGQISLNLTPTAMDAAKSKYDYRILHDCSRDPIHYDREDALDLQAYRIVPHNLEFLIRLYDETQNEPESTDCTKKDEEA
ncbi:unnamed protein product [Rotaria sp. Silwood1]|nr:unnamed protein product [Rotaria sp. Silwood1]CAF1664143.1 unnamed protein product [Rotaria sp. Silwood1]CAF3847123.1 unnamed protein product [Rotaria sp. Silwood1]CAF3863550.1 unnamed protein product [Rotaria sp. Silwood1]CAF3876258.1 unnamed protein product [Rotaria sp. Silwood1]